MNNPPLEDPRLFCAVARNRSFVATEAFLNLALADLALAEIQVSILVIQIELTKISY